MAAPNVPLMFDIVLEQLMDETKARGGNLSETARQFLANLPATPQFHVADHRRAGIGQSTYQRLTRGMTVPPMPEGYIPSIRVTLDEERDTPEEQAVLRDAKKRTDALLAGEPKRRPWTVKRILVRYYMLKNPKTAAYRRLRRYRDRIKTPGCCP